MSEIERYFQVCGFRPDDLIGIGTQGPGSVPRFRQYKVSEAERQLTSRPENANVWINACPMRKWPDPQPGILPTRGLAGDVTRVTALWADLDVDSGKKSLPTFETAWSVIEDVSTLIGARPVVVVLSGHGLQPRWRLAEPWENSDPAVAEELSDFGRLVQLVAERHGGAVDNVFDLPRILRAPGTVNNKDPNRPITVRMQFPAANQGDAVDLQTLRNAFFDYLPPKAPPPPTEPKATSVDLARGSKWLQGALQGIQTKLSDARDWRPGQTDDRGRGWEKLTADSAKRLAELAKAEFTPLTEEEAHDFLLQHVPRGDGWGEVEIERKWRREWANAEPAEPPVERTVQHDDPLAPGYVHPTEGGVALPGLPVGGAGIQEADWRMFEWDDIGNADRIVHMFGSTLRYSPKLERWLRYIGGAWVEDKLGGQWAAQVVFERMQRLEAEFYSNEEYRPTPHAAPTSQRAEFVKFAHKQRFASRAKAAADTIKNAHTLDVELSEFDSHPLVLNTVNGVVDLATGELMPHDPTLLLRQQTPVPYDPDAKSPEWDDFLDTVMPNIDLQAYLQRIVGYSITGSTGEQSLFLHHGPPAAGKSVFLRIIEAMLGPGLSQVVPPTTLLAKKLEQHPTDIAGLEGARFLQMSEVPEGARLDEATVKRMTGEETLAARGMNQDFRRMKIIGKVHMATNHLPHMSDDKAVHRRLHIVPWVVSIPPDRRDINLADRIISTELPGVLMWAVRGTRSWLTDRLARPVQAQIALDEYVEEEDELGLWIKEKLIVTGKGQARTSSDEIFRRYRQWCESRNTPPMHPTTLSKKLRLRGIEYYRTNQDRGFYAIFASAYDPLEGAR